MKNLLLITVLFIVLNTTAQNVGIGTTTPAYKLDVNGNLNIKGDSSIYIYGSRVLSISGGGHNTFLGVSSGNSNTGYFNTAVGWQSLYSTTTFSAYNTAIGIQSMYSTTSGYDNTAVGYEALNSTTTGYDNTAMGYLSLVQNTTGIYNTAIGSNALNINTTGNNNTAIGYDALYYNTSGSYNTATGLMALYNNSTGTYNTAIGYLTLRSNTTGSNNNGIGYQSLYYNTTGGSNIAIGVQSLMNNTIGYYNTGIGASVLINNHTGGSNNAIGDWALATDSSGSYNSAFGHYADISSNNLSNVTIIGNSATGSASNQMRFGNSSITSIGGQVGWTTISDARVKTNIQGNVPGLDFILKLNPVTYTIDVTTLDKLLRPDGFKNTPTQEELDAKNVKSKIVYTGFIAQDVEAIAKQAGYDFSGVDAPKNDKDLYGIRYAEFVVPLVKAVQEMNKQNQSQQIIIDQLKKENEEIKNRLLSLESKK